MLTEFYFVPGSTCYKLFMQTLKKMIASIGLVTFDNLSSDHRSVTGLGALKAKTFNEMLYIGCILIAIKIKLLHSKAQGENWYGFFSLYFRSCHLKHYSQNVENTLEFLAMSIFFVSWFLESQTPKYKPGVKPVKRQI